MALEKITIERRSAMAIWGFKECPCCLEVLPFSAFGNCKNRWMNTQTYCKKCHKNPARRRKPSLQKERVSLLAEELRRCSKCRKIKDLSCFNTSTQTADELAIWCKDCSNRKTREHYVSRGGSAWKNRRKYGDYKKADTCEICGDVSSDGRMHVDHDHACCPGNKICGRCIRGTLCYKHNISLGSLNDDLTGVAEYLERYRRNRIIADSYVTPPPLLSFILT